MPVYIGNLGQLSHDLVNLFAHMRRTWALAAGSSRWGAVDTSLVRWTVELFAPEPTSVGLVSSLQKEPRTVVYVLSWARCQEGATRPAFPSPLERRCIQRDYITGRLSPPSAKCGRIRGTHSFLERA